MVVAAFPPPQGGITVHAERLCHLLARSGWSVEAYETSRRGTEAPKFPFGYHCGNRLSTMIRLLRAARKHERGVVHIHISAGGRAWLMFPGVALLAGPKAVLLTVHSGSFPKRIADATACERSMFRVGFRRVSRVIAVSQAIRDTLAKRCGIAEHRISVIPAFLKAPGESVCDKPTAERGVFLASGFATSTYFWEGLLNAAWPLADIRELVLAFYTRYDHPYFNNLLELINRSYPFKLTIHRDLTSSEFQREMLRASVFVRPTLTDGDSVALREALALGKRVVASDAVPRPAGCLLFRSGDVDALRSALATAEQTHVPESGAVEDSSEALLRVYREVLQS